MNLDSTVHLSLDYYSTTQGFASFKGMSLRGIPSGMYDYVPMTEAWQSMYPIWDLNHSVTDCISVHLNGDEECEFVFVEPF